MAEQVNLEELTLLAAGREAEIYAIDPERVLRLAFSGAQREVVEREALVLDAARDAGAPVAAVHEVVTVAGRPGLILDRLDGPDLLTMLERRPWLVWSAATLLGRIHARLHQVRGPAALPTVREQLREQLESALVPADVRERALDRLAALPDGEALCHCDFHPANLLRGRNGFAVIDCGHAARGDAASDVARTHLLLKHSALPESTGAVMRALTAMGRGIIVSGYMYSYRRATVAPPPAIARWTPIHAAARLAEGIEVERPTMLALANKHV
jgi:Ser/Thr protein kinase RdoA (MazF antagonist)